MNKISEFFSKKGKGDILLIVLFVFGIILFVLSEYIFTDEDKKSETEAFDENVYIANLEEKLCGIIEKIDGVEDVSCMVTLESSARYAFAEQKSRTQSGSTSQSDSSVIFQQDKNGAKAPILTSVFAPEVKGVSVVCRGGSDAAIREKIVFLISSTLNLTSNRIYVTE